MSANIIVEIRELVTIVSFIIGSYVALVGLSTWKKQIKGRTEYDLAKSALRTVYKAREAILFARNPFIKAIPSPTSTG